MRCTWLSSALVAGALVWGAACGTELTTFEDVTVTGRVLDAETGEGIGNVAVSTERIAVYSDFDGTFLLEGRMAEADEVAFRFHKKGYADWETQVMVEARDVDIGVVRLQPQSQP